MSLTQSRSVTSNRSVPDMPPPGRKMSSAEITSFLALNTPIPRRKLCRENEVKNFKRLEIKFRLKNDEVSATIDLTEASDLKDAGSADDSDSCVDDRNESTTSFAVLDSFCGSTTNIGKASPYIHITDLPKQSVDAAQLVSIFRNYVSAYRCLHRVGGESDIGEKTKVYISRGNDAVGQAAIELALAAGAGSVYARAEQKYHTHLKKLGAVPLSPGREVDWIELLRGTADIVIDSVGQLTMPSSVAVKGAGGKLVCIGDAVNYCMSPMGILKYGLVSRKHSYNLLHDMAENVNDFRDDIMKIFVLLDEKKINPRVSQSLQLTDIKSVKVDYRHMVPPKPSNPLLV